MIPRTAMAAEIADIPDASARLLREGGASIGEIARRLGQRNLSHVVISGRGSSGHAGTYLRYLIETRLGLSAAAAAPSVITRYGAQPKLENALYILISQSGRSPDLVAAAEQATAVGAETVAIVNDADSPAALACRHVIPIHAGTEKAVAATKTVTNSLLAGLLLVAGLASDETLAAAANAAPDRLRQALGLDWSPWVQMLGGAPAGFVVGRGLTLGPAREVALKAAEVLGVPVLAYSAAEIAHGPKAAIRPAHPVLGLAVDDEVAAGTTTTLQAFARDGLAIFSNAGAGTHLPWLAPADPALDAIALLVPVYRAIEAQAARSGRDADRPPGLVKVTETL